MVRLIAGCVTLCNIKERMAMASFCAALGVFCFLHLACLAVSAPLPPYHLKVERSLVGLQSNQLEEVHRQATIAIDTPNPLLSWSLQHTDRAVIQKAFQIQLWEHPNLNSPFWDTGKVYGRDSFIRYSGPEFSSGRSYFWKVRWWDHEENTAESEEVGHFMTGILDPSDWTQAKWLAAPSNVTNSPIFTKEIAVDSSKVSSAMLYISGLGFVKPFVNNVDLNARMEPPIALSPGWTKYDQRVAYVVYNITDLAMAAASNKLAMEALVGVGWRNTTDYPLTDWLILPKPDLIPRVLRAIVTVTNSDSKVDTYYSDSTWKCRNSQLTYVTIWDGEIRDATMPSGTSYAAKVTGGPGGKMYTATMPYIAETGSEKPVKIYPRKDGSGKIISQIVDFGNNSAAVCKINVKGITGTISLHHAEVLQHMPFGPSDGSLFYKNLHLANAMDIFTSNGDMDVYQPSLTYHGFRYVEVTGYDRTLTNTDIEKVLYHSNLKPNAKFSSSSKLANEIWTSVVRGMYSNLMSVPTDCDQRSERRGWMGDAGLSAETFLLNFHMEDFFKNFLDLIVDDIIWDTIPDIVPHYRGGRPGDPAWSAAFPEIIYQMSKYVMPDVAGTYYDHMVKYLEKMISFIEPNGIGKYFYRYGDWDPAPEYKKVNGSFTSAFSVLRNIQEGIELAGKLGHTDDATMLKDTFTKQSDAFNKAFMSSSAKYLTGDQVTYVFPLSLGIVPSDVKEDVVKNFINQVSGPDKAHITCGIVGVRNIFNVLSDLKQHDLAVQIVEQMDYPSYGYMIHNENEPATTIWESWACDRNLASRNHHMYSSVSGWIQTEMTGLVLPNNTFHFSELHFHPARAFGLSHASISLEYPKPVHFSWRRNGGLQCAKVAEDQSRARPNLPKHDGLFLSCGDEDGGTIQQILFASFGNPTGHCSYHRIGSCHASTSMNITEKLCLGKQSCTIPTSTDFWGDPCPGLVKWMAVSVRCHSPGALELEDKFSSIVVDVSVPVGSKGVLHLPAHGKKNIKVEETKNVLYAEERNYLGSVKGVEVMKVEPSTDSIILGLESGSYSFKVTGQTPNKKCIDSLQHNSTTIVLSCDDPKSIIAAIDWASFGTPSTKSQDSCFSHAIGSCHYGSSAFAIHSKCIGQHHCSVSVDSHFFGSESHCYGDRLIVEYSCKEHLKKLLHEL